MSPEIKIKEDESKIFSWRGKLLLIPLGVILLFIGCLVICFVLPYNLSSMGVWVGVALQFFVGIFLLCYRRVLIVTNNKIVVEHGMCGVFVTNKVIDVSELSSIRITRESIFLPRADMPTKVDGIYVYLLDRGGDVRLDVGDYTLNQSGALKDLKKKILFANALSQSTGLPIVYSRSIKNKFERLL